MRITRIDHIAVCAGTIDAALPDWLGILGLQLGPREFVAAQKTDVAFVLTAAQGDACVELIAPSGNPSLEKFVAQNGGKAGLHHIAFAVDDIDGALKELAARGVPLIDKVSRLGARGHHVAFLHPAAFHGVLVELVGDHA